MVTKKVFENFAWEYADLFDSMGDFKGRRVIFFSMLRTSRIFGADNARFHGGLFVARVREELDKFGRIQPETLADFDRLLFERFGTDDLTKLKGDRYKKV